MLSAAPLSPPRPRACFSPTVEVRIAGRPRQTAGDAHERLRHRERRVVRVGVVEAEERGERRVEGRDVVHDEQLERLGDPALAGQTRRSPSATRAAARNASAVPPRPRRTPGSLVAGAGRPPGRPDAPTSASGPRVRERSVDGAHGGDRRARRRHLEPTASPRAGRARARDRVPPRPRAAAPAAPDPVRRRRSRAARRRGRAGRRRAARASSRARAGSPCRVPCAASGRPPGGFRQRPPSARAIVAACASRTCRAAPPVGTTWGSRTPPTALLRSRRRGRAQRARAHPGRAARRSGRDRGALPPPLEPGLPRRLPRHARRARGRGHRPGGVPAGDPGARPLRSRAAVRALAAPHRHQPRSTGRARTRCGGRSRPGAKPSPPRRAAISPTTSPRRSAGWRPISAP